MAEFIAVIFFCIPNGQCQFWVSTQTYSNPDSCAAYVSKVAGEMAEMGATVAPTCIRAPKEKAFEHSS